MNKVITVVTATYNRAHLLSDLYLSLCRQTIKDFCWLIIDDGSDDGTHELIGNWLCDDRSFEIKYLFKENGGKNRALNYGMVHVKTPFVMIVDSDDYLTDDAIEYLSVRAIEIYGDKTLAGIAGLRGISSSSPLDANLTKRVQEYIIATNLTRFENGLHSDACEVYRTELLQSHPFKVWQGETFSPEEIIWDRFALEGLSMKWFLKVTCIVRYQENGMTMDSMRLVKNNPMGYAMLYKHRVQISQTFKDKFFNAMQLIAQSVVGKNVSFIFKDNMNLPTLLAFPFGLVLAIRRYIQFKHIS